MDATLVLFFSLVSASWYLSEKSICTQPRSLVFAVATQGRLPVHLAVVASGAYTSGSREPYIFSYFKELLPEGLSI